MAILRMTKDCIAGPRPAPVTHPRSDDACQGIGAGDAVDSDGKKRVDLSRRCIDPQIDEVARNAAESPVRPPLVEDECFDSVASEGPPKAQVEREPQGTEPGGPLRDGGVRNMVLVSRGGSARTIRVGKHVKIIAGELSRTARSFRSPRGLAGNRRSLAPSPISGTASPTAPASAGSPDSLFAAHGSKIVRAALQGHLEWRGVADDPARARRSRVTVRGSREFRPAFQEGRLEQALQQRGEGRRRIRSRPRRACSLPSHDLAVAPRERASSERFHRRRNGTAPTRTLV